MATVGGVLKSVLPVGPDDVYLSYLPLAHILERAAEAAMIVNGAAIGFFQGVKSPIGLSSPKQFWPNGFVCDAGIGYPQVR